ncbi:MAG: membrane protein insertion efficiency factor YidD [Pseudomonadota bacterium]
MASRPLLLLCTVPIRLYQVLLSPVLGALGVRCRHSPSCSAYMLEAMRRHGVWAGGWMGLARWLRCNPWGTCGLDPVPERATGAWWRPWAYARWRSVEPDPAD